MEPWLAFTVAGAAGWFIGFIAGTLRKSNQHRLAVSESLAFDRLDGYSVAGAYQLHQYRDAATQRTANRGPGQYAVPRDYRGASADSGLARRVARQSASEAVNHDG